MALFNVLLTVGELMFTSVVLQYYWTWFIVPLFGALPILFLQSMALVMMFRLATANLLVRTVVGAVSTNAAFSDAEERLFAANIALLFTSLVFWGEGWVLHTLMRS